MQNSKTVKDGNSAPFAMAAVKDNDDVFNWLVSSKRFEMAVTMGQMDGYSSIDKFGLNPSITTTTDPEDIWEGGGIYPFSTTADIVSISSSDNGDTQDLKITGLDANWDEVIQTITLTGQTRKALDTALIRVYRMENEGATDLSGTAYCYSGITESSGAPSGGSVEKARIENGNNQSLMAVYTIPNGKVGFLCRGELGISYTGSVGAGTNFARCYYQSRRKGGIFKIKKAITLITAATSNYVDDRCLPDVIPSETDIKLTVGEVSETMGAWGTFDIILIDEGKFPDAYLTAIGQPGY